MRKSIYDGPIPKREGDEGDFFSPVLFRDYLKSRGGDVIQWCYGHYSYYHFRGVTIEQCTTQRTSPSTCWISLYGDEAKIGEVERIILQAAKEHESKRVKT